MRNEVVASGTRCVIRSFGTAHPGSASRGMKYMQEFSGVTSRRASHAVEYFGEPSGRKEAATLGG
eukprot:m.364917 g.364917  ORF g.364917 m.364917 type:complete len:65 (+) comp16654_c0_seq89:3831-4025(+)